MLAANKAGARTRFRFTMTSLAGAGFARGCGGETLVGGLVKMQSGDGVVEAVGCRCDARSRLVSCAQCDRWVVLMDEKAAIWLK